MTPFLVGMKTWLRYFGLIVAFVSSEIASSAGETSEQAYLRELTQNRSPLQLSRDGQWFVYVDPQGVLHRRSATSNSDVSQKIAVPGYVHVLSASRTAAKVALLTQGGCIAVVTFGGKTDVPGLQWVPVTLLSNAKEVHSCADPKAWVEPMEGPGVRVQRALAISPDGLRLAVQVGAVIRVIDLAKARVVSEFPSAVVQWFSEALLHLRFIDNGRKLLAVNAVLGEQSESPAAGSDMQFAVWDLERGELFNLHRTATKGTLYSQDLLWDYSEATGMLWAINTDGNPFLQPNVDNKLSPVRPYAVSLKQCGASTSRRLTLQNTEWRWLEFAADPQGRWVAVVEPVSAAGAIRSRLLVRDSRTGRLLAEWPFLAGLRSLTPSADGMSLHGVIVEQPTKEQLMKGQQGSERGGTWRRFDLPDAVNKMARDELQVWPAERCLIEGEEPSARDIEVRSNASARIFSLALTKISDERYMATKENICGNEEMQPDYQKRRLWGLSAGGAIWVDRWSYLEQIDPLSGRVDRRIPTPRSSTVCSAALFAEQQFLSWQGDTVTLRPFADHLAPGERRGVVVKPGWRAESVFWLGDGHFGVRWVDARYAGNASAKAGEGSALAIRYRLEGGGQTQVVSTVRGSVHEGRSNFPNPEMQGGMVFPFSFDNEGWDDARRLATDAPYSWEVSHFSSVRARLRSNVDKVMPTVLWDGLRAGPARSTTSPVVMQVLGLSGTMGAAILTDSDFRPTTVAVYDAANRSRAGVVRQPELANVADVAWVERARLLLIQVGTEYDLKLTGFRITR